jgi:hypothetical protein
MPDTMEKIDRRDRTTSTREWHIKQATSSSIREENYSIRTEKGNQHCWLGLKDSARQIKQAGLVVIEHTRALSGHYRRTMAGNRLGLWRDIYAQSTRQRTGVW